ncbi:preprotein translocase subunit SecE [Olsenella sp. An290]|uniref:preprotein translocase subunit SecE n=1 Tax=Olsenella sp. An290 TaxID=1965625 RepID=UPI000B373436|nr:preprotein translocase subunit SecE [Olsenella sp. An290]OUO35785.1 preprotein translocase subunit SecE [Olsenella sp. An290]
MPNKDRNKRSVRKARAEERARVEAAQAASAPAGSPEAAKAVAKAEKKPEKASNKKPNVFRCLANYLGDVRSEMRRVVWPSKGELKSYSVAIVAMLIVFGVVIWLLDSGIVAALIGYTGLRG